MKKRFNVELPARPKVAVIGHSGSGKSTLSEFIAKEYSLPVLHIDSIHFLPGWVEREEKEELALMRSFLDENSTRGWVIDGNYRKLEHERRMSEADLIVYMNVGRVTCYIRAAKRAKKFKGTSRPDMAPGCFEKFDRSFKLWILREGRTRRKLKNYKSILARYPEKSVEIHNARQTERLKRSLLKGANSKC